MKIFANGQEINLPDEIVKMFNQILPPQQEKPAPTPIPQHVVRKVIECRDVAVRNVVIEMNKKLMELEELVKKPKDTVKDKVKRKPIIKPQKTSKVKSSSKQKVKDSKTSLRKKGSKKVVAKLKK